MANGYRFVDREQSFLLPPSLRDWLPADHLVWFLISVVAELDTSGFHRGRVQAGVGRAAYDPDMLLPLLIYGYAHGVGSSRRIESLCSTDVAFRVICAQDPPDHTTIARFRADHRADVEALFTAVLALCARAGLGRLGVVALDGTKIAVDASRQANRSESWLREQVQQMLAEAAEVDAAEDARYGAARGDELPAELVDPTSRQARIRRCLDELVAARRDRERAAQPRAARERRRAARADRDGEAEPEPDPAEADVAEAAESAEPADREADADRPGIELVLCSHGDLVPRSHGDLVPRLDGDLMVRSTGALEQAVQRAEARLAETWKRLSRRWTNYEVTRRLAAQGLAKLPDGRPPVPPEQHSQVRQLQRAVTNARRRLSQRTASEAARAQARRRSIKPEHKHVEREPRRNLTDPDSRLLPSRDGWVQGYNAQLVVSDDHLILATGISQNPADAVSFRPMMHAAEQAAAVLAEHRQSGDHAADRIGVLLADAGYASPDNFTAPGPDRLIAVRNRRRANSADASPPDRPASASTTPRQQMQRRLATPEAAETYKRRGAIVEPVIGHLKQTTRLRQFSCRGLTAANAELAFAGLVLNLVKLHRTTPAT